MHTNQLELVGSLHERSPLRLSPAAVPIMDCWIEHRSTQIEAGQQRQVTAQVRSVAIGPLAEQLEKLPLGQLARFTGFLATPVQRKGVSSAPRLVFHLQAFQLLNQ